MTERTGEVTGVDWTALRSRLAAAGRALAESDVRSEQQVHAVLAERARALARVEAPPADGRVPMVLFQLAGERYAIDASCVREVFRLTELALLPGAAPPLVAGPVRRGDLLMVLDLRRGLGLPADALDDLRLVLVLERPGAAVGVLADEVLGIVSLRPRDVDRSADARTRNQYVHGVTHDAVAVLEASALLRPHS